MVSVPVRGDCVGFASTESDTVPEPEPVAPLETLIQAALEAAVHAQPLPADTVT
jgi:hypothetical protein